ncbi:MAG: TldD/PmbA family protein [Nitrosopumilaceae archaeon]
MSACDRAIDYAKSKGIEECEIVSVKRKIITIRITDSQIAEAKQNQEELMGIRIIHKKKISSSQTTILENFKNSIDQALESSNLTKSKPFWQSLPHEFQQISLDRIFDKKLDEITGSQASDIAQSMIDFSENRKINSISGALNIVSEEFAISNTNNLRCTDKATYISGTVNADSKEGSLPVSGIGQESCRTLDSFSPKQIGEDAKNMCINSINPQQCEFGMCSVIFEPYSVGEILSFVLSSNFNLKTYVEKRSCFSEKIESRIAIDDFDLVDDPHFPDGIGSKSFDDEGIPTKLSPLIEKGVFKNLYSDSYNAFKENKKTSGNALRPGSPMGRSAEPIPTPGTHNLRILDGDFSEEDIIKDTKKGILIGRLWYTYAVNPIKGDFSCTARSGIRIIQDGEIKNPAKPVRIVHNITKLLQNISAIGNNSRNVLQWASLPSICPSIRVEDIKLTRI